MLAGPCGESRDPRLYSAGVLTHLFSRLFLGYQAPVQVFPGSQLHGQRLRALTFLAGAVWLRAYADEPCVSHFQASTGKAFSCVWLSVGGSQLTVPGLKQQARTRGITVHCPPSTSNATSPQHNHSRSHTVGVIHSVPRLL